MSKGKDLTIPEKQKSTKLLREEMSTLDIYNCMQRTISLGNKFYFLNDV